MANPANYLSAIARLFMQKIQHQIHELKLIKTFQFTGVSPQRCRHLHQPLSGPFQREQHLFEKQLGRNLWFSP